MYFQGDSEQLKTRTQGKEIYELVTEDVKPECWKKYVNHKGKKA